MGRSVGIGELGQSDSARTETVELISPNAEAPSARATIANVAGLLDLKVESVEESRRRLSTVFAVTITGTAEQIEGFRRALAADASELSHNLGDGPLMAVLDYGVRAAQRWRRSRRR
jgi:hypothetical protein